jgi:hypothetical protein
MTNEPSVPAFTQFRFELCAEAGSAMKATNNPINIRCTIFIPLLPTLRARRRRMFAPQGSMGGILSGGPAT